MSHTVAVTARDIRRAAHIAKVLADSYQARARELAAQADTVWGDDPTGADRIDYQALRFRHAAEVLEADAEELSALLAAAPADDAATTLAEIFRSN